MKENVSHLESPLNWKQITIATALCAATFLLILSLPTSLSRTLTSEDNVIETLGALLYLLASILAAKAVLTSKYDSKRKFWIALLAILFFLCFAEEISWGQRLFGWQTPDWMRNANAQKETNLHNLWIFHYFDRTGELKTSFRTLLVPTRLLTLFWLTYTFILPLGCRFLPFLKTITSRLGLPLPALEIGISFLALTALHQTAIRYAPQILTHSINETKEMLYALFAVWLVINVTKFSPGTTEELNTPKTAKQ